MSKWRTNGVPDGKRRIMKLIIEIDNDTYLQSYLSILSIGLLECLEKKLISYDDAQPQIMNQRAMVIFQE